MHLPAIYYLSPGMNKKAGKRVKQVDRIRAIAVTLLLSLYFLLPAVTSFAKATLYDGRDGLNSNDIVAVAKDNRGLMWIGTFKGLNIYDGYTFTRLPGVLSNKHITALAFNPVKEEILAGTETGLYRISLDHMKTVLESPGQKAETIWSSQRVNAIFVSPQDNTVFVSFGNGYLARINEKQSLELVCRLPDATKGIKYIVSDDKGLLVSNGNIYRIDLSTKQATAMVAINHLAPVISLFRSANALLINSFGAHTSMLDIHSLSDIMPPALKKKMEKQPYSVVQSTLKDNLLYLLGNNYTLNIINIRTGEINEVSKKYPDVFEGKVYYSLFIDEHNIIWIATNKGLIKVEDRPVLFTKELYNFTSRVSTRKMIEDENGDIYVSSYTGLWRLPSQGQTWENYIRNPEETIRNYPLAVKGPVTPLALCPEPGSNYLYVGFDSEQLVRFDKKKKIFESIDYTSDLKGGSLGGIYSIVSDKKDILWLGCGAGLASYDPATSKLTLHKNDAFDIGPTRVRYIATDAREARLYVATTTGLHILDSSGLVTRLTITTKPALTSNDILFAQQDEEGYLWLGTNGGGINVVSPDLKNIQYIRKKNGLSNEIVYSILSQDRNTFWISTFNGLDRYRKDQQSFSNFFEEDGLSSNEFNQNSFLKTSEGKMYFGSINGITSFFPRQFSSPEPFTVFASGISQWDDKTQSLQLVRDKIDTNNTIIKKPSDLLLELHFGCSDYSDPLRNSYSYRIREISDNWIALEDRHTLNLGGIPYGYYTIEVKAINSRGVSSANVLTFHVKVVQPFYRTWWFFTLILFGLALIFYAAYQIKYQGFKNILHLRMKIASNLHDEVGSLLTRITMFSDNLRYSKNSEEQRNIKLEKIAVLSRDAIASMSDVLWAIDSRNDFAGNLLDRMREHAEEMLFPLGIDVNFVLSGTDLTQPITSDTRGEIYLIFKEAVHNIAKHSEATKVDIIYQISDRNFLLRVTNNKASGTINEQSTGQGLSNMKMRAAKVGARINVEIKDDLFTVEISN